MKASVGTSNGVMVVPDVDDINVSGEIALLLKAGDGEPISRAVVRLREGDFVILSDEAPAKFTGSFRES